MHDARRYRGFCGALLALSCALLALAHGQLKWLAATGFYKQPGFWSVLALSGMALFTLLALWCERDTALDAPAKKPAPRAESWWREWFGPAEYAVYFLCYVYAVPRIGYLPATLLAFPLLALRLGYRNRKMLGAAWATGIVIVVLFKSVLQVKIPGGALYAFFPDAVRNFFLLYL